MNRNTLRGIGPSPFPLERLCARLGNPPWFWPAVLTLIFGLWGIAGCVAPEICP